MAVAAIMSTCTNPASVIPSTTKPNHVVINETLTHVIADLLREDPREGLKSFCTPAWDCSRRGVEHHACLDMRGR